MRFLRPLVATAILCAVALALWLGQWRYFEYPRELVRVNRFSGSAFRLTTEGWESMEREPIARSAVVKPSLDSITAAERAGVGVGIDTPARSLYDEYRRTHPIKTSH